MKLTEENYYSQEANIAYMSVSQFKDFRKCEAAALARLKGEHKEETADCFLIGSYVGAAIEGPEALERFKDNNPGIFSSRGESKGQLKSEYKHADKMIDVLMTDETCREMLSGDKEVIITAELFGTLWKAKLDVYAPDEGRVVDLKTTKGIYEKFWDGSRYIGFVQHFGYDLQMAVYTELERIQNKRFERLEPLIVAVSKEDVPDKAVICFDDLAMEQQLEYVSLHLPRIIEVKNELSEPERCGRCRYCRTTKKVQGMIHYLNLLEVV
jgi:hypothetical protein